MKFSELRQKEIINIRTGQRFGFVCDLCFDPECGKILTLTAPGEGRGGLFAKRGEIAIPWQSICRLGEDIVLVDFE